MEPSKTECPTESSSKSNANRGFNFHTDQISFKFKDLNIENCVNSETGDQIQSSATNSGEFRQRRTEYRCRYCSEKFTSRTRYMNHNHDKKDRLAYVGLMHEIFKIGWEKGNTNRNSEEDHKQNSESQE